MFTHEKRELTLMVDENNSWYWNITRCYILHGKELLIHIDSYTPRALLEMSVVCISNK